MAGATASFDIYGLDELRDDVAALFREYPSETTAELEKITNDFKRDVNKKFPHDGKSGGNKSVSKSWKKDRLQDMHGMDVGAELTNKAPHFHLVENGHNLLVSPERYALMHTGKAINGAKHKGKSNKNSKRLIPMGFVQGKHYCEKTRNEWNNGEFATRIEKHVNKLLKKHDL